MFDDPAWPAGELLVPDDLVIEPASVVRLKRQLTVAPTEVAGVIAPVRPLPPGASSSSLAERLALAPLNRVHEASPVVGAALLRPDVASRAEIIEGAIRVAERPVLVDEGAASHDPWGSPGTIEVASTEGRPVFPWKPLVLLVSGDPAAHGDDSARALANNLLRNGVEARIGASHTTAGLHLTRPCKPTEASATVLDPDVVIALDDTAALEVGKWRLSRRTTIVHRTPDFGDRVHLVDWRVGHASGRVRARIERNVRTHDLVTLVSRLCAGPQPEPPSRSLADRTGHARAFAEAVSSFRKRPTVRSRTDALRIDLIAGSAVDGRRLDGLSDHLRAAGHDVRPSTLDHDTLGSGTDIVVVRTSGDVDRALEVVRRARVNGALTVVDLTFAHLGPDAKQPDGMRLPDGTEDIARAANGVTVAEDTFSTALRAAHVPHQVVPTVVPRQRAAHLRQERNVDPDPRLIAWTTDQASPEAERSAVASALVDLLVERPELRLELVGAPPTALAEASLDGRVATIEYPEPERIAQWSIHLWTPSHALVRGGGTEPYLEASLAGVPTAAGPAVCPAARPTTDTRLLPAPTEATSWRTALDYVLSDRARQRALRRVIGEQSDLLYGAVGAELVAGRLVGWARRLGVTT